jgi:nitrite reductase/ring-hydroxylating ferredoxin subunit
MSHPRLVRVGRLADLQAAGCLTVQADGHTLAVFATDGRVHAVDNRCPHLGFPLNRGSVHDGILTCHWHHARFDLATGGTFDPWADDVRRFPAHVQDGDVWVDVAAPDDPDARPRRVRQGLERDIPLVIAKAVLGWLEEGGEPAALFRAGLDFGTHYRQDGWGQGLTIHTCLMNLWPHLDARDRPRAAFHGLSAVARDSAASPPRFRLPPLPGAGHTPESLGRWLRQFIELRDAEGAERCLVSAVREGVAPRQVADMLFAAATDHRYIDIGHPLDFTNKALEALDHAGWEHAEAVLTSLVSGYAGASRMEESSAWRQPVDLVAILESAFERLPAAVEAGRDRRGRWTGRDALVPVLLAEDPAAIAEGLLAALRDGADEAELAGMVSYAAALRIARFPVSNEFGDWDTALHTFTFANAVHQGLRRSPSPELLRGVFDAAMSVYLDRFLNVPAVPLPEPGGVAAEPAALLEELDGMLDRQQQVNEAGRLVGRYLHGGAPPERLVATLGRLLLREDRDFHTIQVVEAAVRQHGLLGGTPTAAHVLVASARYLAAHAPTVRAQGQTYQAAYRLHRGEALFEGA